MTKSASSSSSWTPFGSSVRGDSHRRKKAPNQDAIKWTTDSWKGFHVVAVSDGHGSKSSFRSDVGARLAVETALEIVLTFLERRGGASPNELRRQASRELPGAIVERWRKKVFDDIAGDPLPRSRGGEASGDDGTLAYGATLMVVAASDRTALFVQIGDGDIVTVSSHEDVESPIARDHRLIANETTSLCQPSAVTDFSIEVRDVERDRLELIFASTDGYGNAFKDEDWMVKAGRDIRALLDENGPEWVSETLPEWLKEASKLGDDVTMGVLWRAGAGGRGAGPKDPTLGVTTPHSDTATRASNRGAESELTQAREESLRERTQSLIPSSTHRRGFLRWQVAGAALCLFVAAFVLAYVSTHPNEIGRWSVGPEGDKLNFDSGRLVIPQGSLRSKTTIIVLQHTAGSGVPIYSFEPHDLTFASPVTIAIRRSGNAQTVGVYSGNERIRQLPATLTGGELVITTSSFAFER